MSKFVSHTGHSFETLEELTAFINGMEYMQCSVENAAKCSVDSFKSLA